MERAFRSSRIKLCKQLDPTRPTTIEHVFSGENQVTCDIISRHYQPMPYDEILQHDPRPFLHGECFFEVYHERTDVAIDPGLRELWADGSADPNSDWGKACLKEWDENKFLVNNEDVRPGIYPGAWSYIYASQHCIGSEIWAGMDDISFLAGREDGQQRKRQCLLGLGRLLAPAQAGIRAGQICFLAGLVPGPAAGLQARSASVRVPVENRHSFTDLSQFDFAWQMNDAKGKARISAPPATKGEIEIPIPQGTPEGSTLLVRVMNGGHEIVKCHAVAWPAAARALASSHWPERPIGVRMAS